jgi:hypothetical protein
MIVFMPSAEPNIAFLLIGMEITRAKNEVSRIGRRVPNGISLSQTMLGVPPSSKIQPLLTL